MTAVLDVPTEKLSRAHTILQRSVCLTLQCHQLGNNRKIDLEKLVAETGGRLDALALGEDTFKATKKLIDPSELTPAYRAAARAKNYLRAVAISAHEIFGDRTYLVPLDLVQEVDAQLTAFEAEVRAEAAKLAARYEAAVQRQKAGLGSMFRASDYASAREVEAAFGIDWSYVSFAAPDRLETVDRALAQAAHRKHETRLAQAFDEVLAGLRASALEIVTDLEDRLTPPTGDGRKKAIRGTALRDLEQFIEYLPKRNLADDTQLAAVMERVRKRAAGYTVEDLRDSDAARAALRTAVTAAKRELAKLVQDGPRRAMDLGGEA